MPPLPPLPPIVYDDGPMPRGPPIPVVEETIVPEKASVLGEEVPQKPSKLQPYLEQVVNNIYNKHHL